MSKKRTWFRNADISKNDKDSHQKWWSKASKFTSRNHIFDTLCSHTFGHTDFRIVEKQRVFIAYSPHWFATTMSENDQKTTTRLTIHQSYKKPPKIKNINISLYQQQIHLLKKWKRRFQDPPNYLPERVPELQGPLKTPQTSRGPPKTSPGPSGDTLSIPNDLWDSLLTFVPTHFCVT